MRNSNACGISEPERSVGKEQAVVALLEAKWGRLTKSLRQRIETLSSGQLCQLLVAAAPWESLGPLDA